MVEACLAIPGLFAFSQLVEHHEKRDELSIDVIRSSILSGAPGRGHDDWPDQAAIRFHRLIDVSVVKPQTRAFSSRRTAGGISEPCVGKVAAWRHGNSRQIVRVNSSFILFVIAEAMHVDAVVGRRKISKMHHHRVSYFRPDDGAQNPEPFGLRLTLGKTTVCVLDKPGLVPASMKAPRKRNVFSVH